MDGRRDLCERWTTFVDDWKGLTRSSSPSRDMIDMKWSASSPCHRCKSQMFDWTKLATEPTNET